MRNLPTDANGQELTPPPVNPDLSQRRAGEEIIPLMTQVRRYKLITPLFGGGVEPGIADPVTLIRGSEIRGHLRFWWRATRGGQFNGDLRAMKEAEDLLWGAASTAQKPRPSQVQIAVEITNRGEEEQPFQTKTHAFPGWRDLAYAAFPLQESQGKVQVGVMFTLTLTFPQSQQSEVEAALWAWETFGGIGARTRRGFGALRNLDADPPQANAMEQFIRKGLQCHTVDGTWPNGVPHLTPHLRLKITAAHPDPRAAWEYLIRRLKNFRQSRYPGAAPNRPGRSKWPEPDAIRRLTGQRDPRHSKVHSQVDKFPRAAFGLPIVFHFKDQGDPDDTVLQGREHNRLASSLILRPLACAGGQAVGLALILEGSSLPPGGLVLKDAPHDPTVQAELTQQEAQTIPPLGGNTNVLQAFLDTL
jgi:CRISPR-associated protein Cmr1